MHSARLGLLAAAAALVALPLTSRAADFTWVGGSGNSNWSTGANWVGGAAPANNGTATVVYDGRTNFNVSYVTPNYFINTLAFSGNEGYFVLSTGPTLTLNTGGILQGSSVTQQVGAPVRALGSQVWGNNGGTGGLSLTGNVGVGNVSDGTPTNLTLDFGAAPLSFGALQVGFSDANTAAPATITQNAGTVTVATLSLGSRTLNQFGEVAKQAGGDYVLNGGTLTVTGAVSSTGLSGGGKGSPFVGNRFTFNGGTLRAAKDGNLLGVVPFLTAQSGGAFVDTNGFNVELGKALDGPGALTKLGNGTLTLSTSPSSNAAGFDSNAYVGGTNVNAGTLRLAGNAALPFAGMTTIAFGAKLDVNDTAQAVSRLAGQGSVVSTAGGGTLRVGAGAGLGDAFGGTITGTLGLEKIAFSPGVRGTLILTNSNPYSGPTTVTDGTLTLASGGEIGNTSAVNVNGGTLRVNAGGFVQTAAATVAGGTAVLNGGAINSTGPVAVNAANATAATPVLQLDSGNLNAFAGETVGNAFAGTVNQTGGTNSITGGLALGASATGAGTYNQSGGTVLAGSATVGGAGTGAFNLSAGTATLGALAVAAGGNGSIAQTGGTVNASSITLGNGGVATYTLAGNTPALNASGNVTVGSTSGATVTQSAGSVNVTGERFIVGQATATDAVGTYTLSAGSLATRSSGIGVGGTGVVNQSGGTWTTGGNPLIVGGDIFTGNTTTGRGTLNLSGGTLTSGTTYVGLNGAGVVNQTGGLFDTTTSRVNFGIIASDSGTYTLAGGTLKTVGFQRFVGTATLNLDGGTLQAGASGTDFLQGLTAANVRRGGAILDTAGSNITVAQPLLHDAALNTLADGGLTKRGNGTLVLTGDNTYNGGTTVDGGILSVDRDAELGAAAGTVTLASGGKLAITGANFATARTFNLNSGTLAPAAGSTISYNGATLNGGFLGAGGTHALNDGSTLNGTAASLGSVLTTAGSVSFNSATLRGRTTVNAGSTVAATDTVLSGAGTLNVGGTINALGFESNGVINLNPGGTLATTVAPIVLGGGSRTFVGAKTAHGGTITAGAGATIEVNGALLVNNGTQAGTLDANFGSLVKGAGTFGSVNVTDGGTFSPGNSPGTATVSGDFTFGAGGSYQFELNTAAAAPGTGQDFIDIGGLLSIEGGTTPNSRFTIALVTLDSADGPAALTDFDPSKDYSYALATAAGGIAGFDPAEFALNTAGFANAFGGTFSVSQSGNTLLLNYKAVPEPSSLALLGLGGLALRRRRRAGRA